MEGVKVTSAGRAPPEAAASSILVVPSFKVVIKATQAPLAPSNFWFVTEGMLSTTATAALVTAPSPCLVMVTVLPLLEAAKVPSMPLVMVAAVAATAWKVLGNSMMILPSLGIGFPVVKESALAPSAPATKVAGATVGVTPLKMEGVKVTSAGKSPPVASSSVVSSF